jgi:hypothetical protein
MNKDSKDSGKTEEMTDRRSAGRSRDDADWESKVIGRIGSRLRNLSKAEADHPELGWEAQVLDTLRKRIESGPK